LIYYKKDSSILGKAVKCECGVNSVNIICPLCNVRISISDRDNDAEIGEKIKCPNCTKEFEYKENIELNKEENVYFENLRCIKSLEGKKFEFPVYYDVEEPSILDTGSENVNALIKTFCGELEKNNYYCGGYGSLNRFKELFSCYKL